MQPSTIEQETQANAITRPRVCVRIRPMLPREMKETIAIQACGNAICTTNPHTGEQRWSQYEQVFGSDASQEDVYDALGAPCVESVRCGVSSCVFAHGQTGTGKTHSIVGASRSSASDAPSSGLLPRMTAELLENGPLEVTMVELYRDKIRDLLGYVSDGNKAEIRRHPKHGAYIDNAHSCEIRTVADAEDLFALGFGRRIEAATVMNGRSSRGHCVVTLTTRDGTKLCCVDLAGRENDKTTTENNPERLAELAFINLSLFHLSQVVTAIRQKAAVVPYRNSKLTLLLEDCMRTQRMFLLTCVSPAVSAYDDSVLSLRMASMTCQLPAGKLRRRSEISERHSRLSLPCSLSESVYSESPPLRRSSLLLPSNGPVLGAEAHLLAEDPRRPKSPTLSTLGGRTLACRPVYLREGRQPVCPQPYPIASDDATTGTSGSTSSISSRSDLCYAQRMQRVRDTRTRKPAWLV